MSYEHFFEIENKRIYQEYVEEKEYEGSSEIMSYEQFLDFITDIQLRG